MRRRRVLWYSWSEPEAIRDLSMLSSLSLEHEWVDGNKVTPNGDDIILTGNGYHYTPNTFFKATIYAEPYIYLSHEYDNLAIDSRWDLRFTYNPDHLVLAKIKQLPIAGYWKRASTYYRYPKTNTFGMVLSKKPTGAHPTDIGYLRAEFVSALRGHSFNYWGSGWDKWDKSYKGTCFTMEDKFIESRMLLSICMFGLALDNSMISGYVTEKLWNCLWAGTVPIYCGHRDVLKLGCDAIIYCKGDVNAVIDLCVSMSDDEYHERLEACAKFVLNDVNHSYEEWFRQIDIALPR